MATVGNILAIPEQTVVGSGSYVIPANKYAHISMTTSTGAAGYAYGTAAIVQGSAGSASANANHQWLVAGDSITTFSTIPSIVSTSVGGTNVIPRAEVLINTQIACCSTSMTGVGLSTSGNTRVSQSTFQLGWTVALFPIPKNNLPAGLIEGN